MAQMPTLFGTKLSDIFFGTLISDLFGMLMRGEKRHTLPKQFTAAFTKNGYKMLFRFKNKTEPP